MRVCVCDAREKGEGARARASKRLRERALSPTAPDSPLSRSHTPTHPATIDSTWIAEYKAVVDVCFERTNSTEITHSIESQHLD